MAYDAEDSMMRNPIKGGFTVEHAQAAFTLAALLILWLIGRGFRGVSVGGVSVGVS